MWNAICTQGASTRSMSLSGDEYGRKRVIEVDEYERRLIIDSLNDRRNALIEKGADIGHVDDVLLDVIDAPTRKQKRKIREMER